MPKRKRDPSIIDFFRGTAQIPIEIDPFFDPSSPQFDITQWFPLEISLLIFSHLSSCDVCSLSRVNKHWRIILEHDSLWERLFKKEKWKLVRSKYSILSWKFEYRSRKLIMKNWVDQKFSTQARFIGISQPEDVIVAENGKCAFVLASMHLLLLQLSSMTKYSICYGVLKFIWIERLSTVVMLLENKDVILLRIGITEFGAPNTSSEKVEGNIDKPIIDFGITKDKIFCLHSKGIIMCNLSLEVEMEIPLPADILGGTLSLVNNENFIVIESNRGKLIRVAICGIPKTTKDEVSYTIKDIERDIPVNGKIITQNYYSVIDGSLALFQTLISVELSTGKISRITCGRRPIQVLDCEEPDMLLLFDVNGDIVPKKLPTGEIGHQMKSFSPLEFGEYHLNPVAFDCVQMVVRGRMVGCINKHSGSKYLEVFDALSGKRLVKFGASFCTLLVLTDEYLFTLEGSGIVLRDFTNTPKPIVLKSRKRKRKHVFVIE